MHGWDPVTGLGSVNFSALRNRTFYVKADESTDDKYTYNDDDDDFYGRGVGFDKLNFLLGTIAMASIFFLILEFVIENWSILCGDDMIRACVRECRRLWRKFLRLCSFWGEDLNDDDSDWTDGDEMIPINFVPRRGPRVQTTIAQ